jgi:hypothetical protein
MRTSIRLLSTLLALVSAAAFGAGADLSGTWTASFDTQIGTQNYTYEFHVQGSTLTGTAKSANGESAIEDGKVNGNTVSFVEKFTYQGMPLTITYTGEVVSANEIHFKRDVAGLAMEELVAKRKQ